MAGKNVYRVVFINFISSIIIAIVTCDIFYAFGLKGGMYLGNLFGLYFLVVYGVNNLVEARKIPNNSFKFILIIVFIILFDAIFLFITPLIFGPDAFPANELLNINYNGVQFALKLSKELYLVLFAIIMLIFNIIIDMRNQYVYYEE
jgi:predicted histidine transporter YuiF (NhaC family)